MTSLRILQRAGLLLNCHRPIGKRSGDLVVLRPAVHDDAPAHARASRADVSARARCSRRQRLRRFRRAVPPAGFALPPELLPVPLVVELLLPPVPISPGAGLGEAARRRDDAAGAAQNGRQETRPTMFRSALPSTFEPPTGSLGNTWTFREKRLTLS